MQRVMVIGCGGAGKSTLAREVAMRTGLPLVHLDQHYWRPGWREPAKDDWREHVAALAARPCWIMDGNYGDTIALRLARADTVIFLDLPRWRCLSGVLGRAARWYGRSRDDMAPGCPERIDGAFLRYVWRYRRNHRPRVLTFLQDFSGDQVHLRSRRAVRDYLGGLALAPEHEALPERRSARIILLNDKGEVLLFRYRYPNPADGVVASHFWGIPGGGLEPGEGFGEAAIRELEEETGIVISEIAPPLLKKQFPMIGPHGRVWAIEEYFVVWSAQQAIDTRGFTEEERSGIVDHRWWTSDELEWTSDKIFPSELASIVRGLTKTEPRVLNGRRVAENGV